MCADTHNIADGTSATIKIVEKDADGNDDDVAALTAKVQNKKIECTWKVIYTADDDDADSKQEQEEKGYTLPEYAFTIECDGEKSAESEQLDVYADYIAKLTFKGKIMKDYPYALKLADGSYRNGNTDGSGLIIESEIPIGNVKVL